MKFQVLRPGLEEHHEASHFRILLKQRFSESTKHYKDLADSYSDQIGGWCSFLAVCLNIEGKGCKSTATLNRVWGSVIDEALKNGCDGWSSELELVKDTKKQLYTELLARGFTRERVAENAESIKQVLYYDGALLSLICDKKTARERTRNLAEALSMVF